MSVLTDRASLLREFHRLTNTDATDDDMIEHDSSTLEGAYQLLQSGLEDAQLYLMDQGLGDVWAKTTSTLSFTGTDPDKHVDLPADFLRLDGDQWNSALVKANGTRWGQEINLSGTNRRRGKYYYIKGYDGSTGLLRIYVTRDSGVPSGLTANYFYRLPALADSTTVDFPQDDRPLITAFAAVRASFQAWYSGGIEGIQRLDRNLMFHKAQAVRRSRHSRQPKQATPYPMTGDHWIT